MINFILIYFTIKNLYFRSLNQVQLKKPSNYKDNFQNNLYFDKPRILFLKIKKNFQI